ncbi:Hypothetical predicted protein [Podarcis lilfordi]|uniref:Uncharacterized protein n=1 Tax=Podarcis lilfordi TaxID=74358 RepID=A0AA35KMK4_9SAUR|nr:Hypothetical predicted protein [Podarcis lilfordi]
MELDFIAGGRWSVNKDANVFFLFFYWFLLLCCLACGMAKLFTSLYLRGKRKMSASFLCGRLWVKGCLSQGQGRKFAVKGRNPGAVKPSLVEVCWNPLPKAVENVFSKQSLIEPNHDLVRGHGWHCGLNHRA